MNLPALTIEQRSRPIQVTAMLEIWSQLVDLVGTLELSLEQAGAAGLEPGLLQFVAELATTIFGAVDAHCDLCGCCQSKACAGGCSWDLVLAVQGLPRCSRCAKANRDPAARRILTPEDPGFQDTMLRLHR